MSLEIKLDQDFLFYLDFVSTYYQKLKDENFQTLATEWLTKLCSERCVGIERKRCRNIYLAQLLLQMQEGKLKGEFLKKPTDVDIIGAMDVFQPIPEDLDEAWSEDVDFQAPQDVMERKQGNTIVASRTLKNGQGAFAYLGLSLSECEPKWMSNEGGGDLAPIQKVLSKRKTPQERQNCVNFFDVLLQSIRNELQGEQVDENEVVDNCLESMIADLQEKNEYTCYANMEDKERRTELLKVLQEKVIKTQQQVLKRTEALDSLVNKIYPNAPTTFPRQNDRFSTCPPPSKTCPPIVSHGPPMGATLSPSAPQLPDRQKLSDQLWAQAAAQVPAKKNMVKLVDVYPQQLIERFLVLLRYTKGILLERYQNRHEMIVNQMQSELSDAIVKNMMKLSEAQKEHDKFHAILALVKKRFEIYQKKLYEVRVPPAQANEKSITELSDMIKQMSNTISEEAKRGKLLAEEVNNTHTQLDKYKSILKDIISKSEHNNKIVEEQIAKLMQSLENNKDKLKVLKKLHKQPKHARTESKC
ncbi:uncharacterized protein LOC109604772 [Aethina tumida]|uniref:uncharacterized protein LOC109604772 n=1 Tax=Aethina tumida TaxID=116153 RepID=UPI00096B5140|nr:uncharacterized protein LOC109604772 [Aethina tumida]